VVAVVVLVAMGRHAGNVSDVERNLFQLLNSLPGGLQSLFRLAYSLGQLWAVGLVVAAALIGRRWRLARDLLASGVLAWAAGRILGALVVQHAGLADSIDAVTRAGKSPSFPLVRLAVVVAIVAAASPYLTRLTRRVGMMLWIVLALAALYLGTAFPNDIVAAIVLGWGVAAAVHLLFGSPGGRPTTAQVAASLEELGVKASGVHLAPTQPTSGATLMLGDDDRGRLWVKVIGRDEADAQFLAKLWRFVVYKDSGPMFFWTRVQQVEHEAYATLRARDAGVRVADVVTAATAGPGVAVLVERRVSGSRLGDVDSGTVTDALLDDLWHQVGCLHRAHLAHGELHAGNVLIDDTGPTLVGFAAASVAGTADRRPNDVAELLASTAAVVGPARAVDAAARGIGPDALSTSLPLLQPAALSRETRATVGRKELRDRLKHLRELGAAAAGTDPPALEQFHRVKGSNILMAVGLFVAVGALMSQVGSPAKVWETVKDANWAWVAVATALSLATNVGYAIGVQGCVTTRIPLVATTELQLAMSFSNLAVPAVGGTATQVRFLQKQGVDLATAVAAGGLLSSIAGIVVQIMIFAVALWLTPDTFKFPNVPTSGIIPVVLAAVAVIGAIAGLVLGIPRLRKVVVPPVKVAVSSLWGALRSPRQLMLMFVGNAIVAILYGLCLLAALEAFGASLSFWTILVINIGIGTIASLVPVPGGSVAVSSIGFSGALTAFGVPTEVAVSAILTHQIVVSYVPAVVGWFATTDMIRRDEL